MKRKKQIPALFWTAVVLIPLFVLWEIAARAGTIPDFLFSSPTQIWADFCKMLASGLLLHHLKVTAIEAALGLLFGGTFGILTGIFLGTCPKLSPALMPIMTGLNALPKLALAPIFILWFGIGLKSKVMMSALMVFFIFVFNLYAGVRGVSLELVRGVRLLGASKIQIFTKVVLPSVLPWLFTALRTGIGLSIAGAVVGEYLGATEGLGWLITNAGERYNMTRVLGCILAILACAILLDGAVRLLERKVLHQAGAEF